MSRIKQMREIKTKSLLNKKENYMQRENGWDDRFYLSRLKDYSNVDKSQNSKNIRKYNLESNLNYIKSQIKSSKRDTKSSYSKYRPSKSGNHYGNMTSNNFFSNYNYNYDDELMNMNVKNNFDDYSFIKNMNNEEIDTYIKLLWDDLGVLNDYRKSFYDIVNPIENNCKNEFFSLEIENLKHLESYLIKFKNEKEKREKCISQLKRINSVIEKHFINLGLDIADNVMRDFTKEIQNIRNFTINIVLLINNIREMSSYSKINNKFDLENSKYNFTQDYLIKIRDDLGFLGKSAINNYRGMKLKFNSQGDPFLISINNFIPISPDNLKKLRQCQYIIMQDAIFNNSNNNISKSYNDNKKNNRYNNDNNIFENKSHRNKKIIIDYNGKDNDKKDNDNDYKLDDNINKLKKKLEPIKKENKKEIENIGLNDIKKEEEFNKFLKKKKECK